MQLEYVVKWLDTIILADFQWTDISLSEFIFNIPRYFFFTPKYAGQVQNQTNGDAVVKVL